MSLVLALLLQTQAEQLVEKLRSDSVEERTRATRALEALGATAVPALKKAAQDPDREVALRARAILVTMPSGEPVDKVALPGSDVSFEVVNLPGGAGGTRHKMDEAGRRARAEGFELRPFGIGAREVTWEEFRLYYKRDKTRPDVDGVTRPSDFVDIIDFMIEGLTTTGKFPASCVQWHSAIGYCDWLSRVTGHYFRLPTEAEWEHAARAGQDRNAPDALEAFAWTRESEGVKRPREVGSKKPNRHGLYDMLGNVWEYGLEPLLPGGGPVLRGGGFELTGAKMSFEIRETILPRWYDSDPHRPRSLWHLTDAPFVGFRVTRVPGAARSAEREGYAKQVLVRILAVADLRDEARARGNRYVRVSGELENSGTRVIDELELAVHFLNADGTPRWVDAVGADMPGRPAFNKGWPVLPNSAWIGQQGRPLEPKGVRKFVVDVPFSYDPGPALGPGAFGATVTQLCLRP